MHFTLWPNRLAKSGGYAEITWDAFLAFVAEPQVTELAKEALEGWSPARFGGDGPRTVANVLSISCIVLDDDKSGLSFDELRGIWPFDGVVHTSFSSAADAPKYRIVLRCSRDMSPAEHARVWSWARDWAVSRGQPVDEATKDPSRLWFVPARAPAGSYECLKLAGAPLDVDTILAAVPAAPAAVAAPVASAPTDRRRAMALALGAAWPAKGRHEAQLALAGALRGEGWAEADAVDFLCSVCGAAGDADRAKREATCRHTWGRPEGSPLTGWTRLKASVDPVIVDAARGVLARGAEWTEKIARRLEMPNTETEVTSGGLGFEFGCWTTEPPPIEFLVDELIPRGSVGMFFGRADALKTWLLFSLGLSVATGKAWLGRYGIAKSMRVGIVDFETGKANVDRRLYMLGAGGATQLGRKSFAKLKPNDPAFWVALTPDKFDLIIVDSLRRANAGANENESGEAIVPLELAAEFSELTRASVLFIHHAKKASDDGWPEFRGSGAIEDQVDVSYSVRKTDISNALKSVDIRCEKPGDMRKPDPFSVEISFDDGAKTANLKHITTKKAEEEPAETNNARAVRILSKHPAGIKKLDLHNMLKGRNEERRKDLSELSVAGTTIEYKANGKEIFIMLNPNLGRS